MEREKEKETERKCGVCEREKERGNEGLKMKELHFMMCIVMMHVDMSPWIPFYLFMFIYLFQMCRTTCIMVPNTLLQFQFGNCSPTFLYASCTLERHISFEDLFSPTVLTYRARSYTQNEVHYDDVFLSFSLVPL